MITVNQDEYIRMLDLLKYQAEFILKNTNVDKVSQDKESVLEYLNMCNDLLITFDQYIAVKDKYQLSDSQSDTLNETKKSLDDYVNKNWDVENFRDTRNRGGQGNCS